MRKHGVWNGVPDIKSTVVPLWHSHEDGDLIEGFLDIPSNLCGGKHTNAALKRHKLIRDHVGRWIEWRAKQGWLLATTPHVSGPYDIPRENPAAPENTELKRYLVKARFKRKMPLAISLDDYLAVRDAADMYGVDLSKPRLTRNILPTPKEEIIL